MLELMVGAFAQFIPGTCPKKSRLFVICTLPLQAPGAPPHVIWMPDDFNVTKMHATTSDLQQQLASTHVVLHALIP